jgi:hypothetical protein
MNAVNGICHAHAVGTLHFSLPLENKWLNHPHLPLSQRVKGKDNSMLAKIREVGGQFSHLRFFTNNDLS